ncbi:hypothetical protein HAX54_043404 [Datura stramonium]|uniref:Uncharacterized protein n=1 Tax=Datura stramonium TaxID=4076 RepID=A0ABS8SN36_DATST|nr:hypothetical protein [Datura stramonium]
MGYLKKIILIFLLAFYFSSGFYQARIFPSAEQLNNNHNGDGETTIVVSHAVEAHVGGGRGGGGDVNGDGSRSPSTRGSSNFIPIYAANAQHNHHRGAATSHRSHNGYLALYVATVFTCLCT